MDALSLVANLIAVGSAAVTVSQKLRKLANLRDVPQQILLLANEVSDFRCVLVVADETVRSLGDAPAIKVNAELVNGIEQLIVRAHKNLDEVDGILDSGLIRNLDANPERVKVSWGKWLKKNGHLKRLSSTLRDTRVTLAEALTILTASQSPSVHAHLESIIFMTNDTKRAASKALGDIDMQVESITRQVAILQPSIDEMQTTLRQLQVAQQPPKAMVHNSSRLHSSDDQGSIFRVRTALRKSCNPSCRCRCHDRTSLSSPKWMKDIIGLMFVDYTGKPILGKQTCSEKMCRQQENGLLKITYYFPVWLLQRMIVFRDYSKSFLAGEHTISIRTPRIIDPYGDPVVLAQGGNIQAMQMLFSQRFASPFDTTPIGESLLHIAAAAKRLDMCRLLICESADPNQESMREGTPIDIVWDHILQDPYSTSSQELKTIFDAFLDADNDLQNKGFSILHQCVLGLNHMNLKDYLHVTTAEIDGKCAMGRPPLFWAASSSNLAATRSLLEFGADINYIDPKGQCVLHRAVMGTNIEVLKTILRTACSSGPCDHNPVETNTFSCYSQCTPNSNFHKLLNHEDSYGWSALAFAAEKNRPDLVEVLLDYGAAIQTTRESLAPVLIVAIQTDAILVAEVLLRRGARMGVRDSTYLDGVLSIAANNCSSEMFELLGDHNNCYLNTLAENLAGQTPLQSFDNERQKFIDEDKETFLENRAAFMKLLARIEQWNLDHGFKEKEASDLSEFPDHDFLETTSIHSDDEDFFDTRSTFEDLLEVPKKER